MKDLRKMTEAELAKLNAAKKEEKEKRPKEEKEFEEDIFEEEKMKKVPAQPQPQKLSRAQNAFVALEQIKNNMEKQDDMHKFNLIRFGYEYLLNYLDDQYKKEFETGEASPLPLQPVEMPLPVSPK